jgi:hypothetical protein
MSTADETKDSSHLPLLGLTVPLNSLSESCIETDYDTRIRHRKRIPNAVSDWSALPLSFRERHMIKLMGQLTDEPDWKQKIQDEEIVKKWKKESVERWQDEPVEKQFSEKMFDYVRDQVFCIMSTELIVFLVYRRIAGLCKIRGRAWLPSGDQGRSHHFQIRYRHTYSAQGGTSGSGFTSRAGT